MNKFKLEILFFIITIVAVFTANTGLVSGLGGSSSHLLDYPYPNPTPYPYQYPTPYPYEYPVDSSPFVISITRNSSNPTSSGAVDYQVLLSESVTGVDLADFSLSADASIFGSSIKAIKGSNDIYIVTVKTGIGNGLIRLDVNSSATIKDFEGKSIRGVPFTDGETYLVERPISAPTLQTPRSGITINKNTLTFGWSKVRYAESYEIEFATDESFSSIIQDGITNGTSYKNQPGFVDGTYYWRVRAALKEGNFPGLWSKARKFTIDTIGPVTPTLISPSDKSTSSTKTPIFNWTSSNDAVLYEFQHDNNSDFSSPIFTDSVRGTSLKVSSMRNGVYFWHVRAKDANGNWSEWSLAFTITLRR